MGQVAVGQAAVGQAAAETAEVTGALRGIAMMRLGVRLLALDDAPGRVLLGTDAVSRLMRVRSAAGLCATAPFVRRAGPGASLRAPRPGLPVRRAAFSMPDASLFLRRRRDLALPAGAPDPSIARTLDLDRGTSRDSEGA